MVNHIKTRKRRHYPHHRSRKHKHHQTDASLRVDNFYLWANRKWLNEVPKTLPRELKYIRPLDNFKLIQDEMYKNVLTMMHEYTRNKTVVARQMKHVMTSFRDLNPEPILGHISDFCKLYKELVQENNLYKFLGVMNQCEMVSWALPIVWNIYPDEYTPGKLSAHICGPSLSLYDYRFYLNDSIIEKQMRGVRVNVSKTSVIREDPQIGGARQGNQKQGENDTNTSNRDGPETKTIEYIKYKHRITKAFMKFIDDVFTKCLGRDYEKTHNIKAQDVYETECLIMNHMTNIDERFDENYANIYQTANHPDKPPHLSETKKHKEDKHRHCDCADSCAADADIDINERLKTPHYRHNIRGATRVLTRDALCLTDIDWPELAKWIGYPTIENGSGAPPYFIALQVGYLKSVMTCLKKEWASDKWKSYWYFIYMRQLICFHDKWRDIYFDFNDTLIRGKDTHFPREYFPILGLAYMFPKTMTNEFTRRFKNEEMITKVREIGNTVLECFKTRIQKNTWMSAYTKKGALKKLNTLKLNVGEANLSAPDPTTIEYDPKDAWGNLKKRSHQRTLYLAKHHTSSEGKLTPNDIDLMNWGTMKLVGYQSFVVNAYYTPNSNSIYIPTAYMHSMNVQFGRGYEYDLASVGFTFGHEISHALHVSSRVYNHRGIIKNWWSRDDISTYERKIAAIRKQYEAVSKKDGFVIDGNLSLPENLADVTGLAVCEEALDRYHAKSADGTTSSINQHIRNMSFHNFYTYYAIQSRQYANHREILVQVLTNPHLNMKIRTNVPLMRSKTFHEVNEIKKSDKMYNDDFDAVF
jgi:predicted metalloendopeptidase